MNNEEIVEKLGALDAHVVSLRERMAKFETVCEGCRNNVNGKFNAASDSQSRTATRLYDKIDDLQKEITSLKVKIAFFSGAAALVGGLIGPLISLLFSHMFE